MKKILNIAFIVTFTIIGCSSSNTTDLSSLSPSLAISAPTARSSSSAISRSAVTELPKASEIKTELTAILAKKTIKDCFNGLSVATFSKTISCYGPQLVVASHPGGALSGNCPASVTSGDKCLPSGDLGIWSATDASGEACAAAQLNALAGDVSTSINSGMKFMNAMICAAQTLGKTAPLVGDSYDLKTDIETGVTGASITTATIERNANYTGTSDPVYKMTLIGNLGSGTMSLTLRHSPSSTTAGNMRGQFYGYVTAGSSDYKGFSVVYEQSGSTLYYVTKTAITPTSAGTSFFSADNTYNLSFFTSTASSRDARYLIANVDSNGLGTVKFAWQAGPNDNKARVFNANVSTSGGSTTGFAYFGFGPKIDNASVGTIGGMCCNWAGPGGTCSVNTTNYDVTNSAQSQSFTRNASGIFTPNTSNITYAPTNACTHTPATAFKYGTVTEWGSDGTSVAAAHVPAHALTNLTALGTIPAVTSPTFSP